MSSNSESVVTQRNGRQVDFLAERPLLLSPSSGSLPTTDDVERGEVFPVSRRVPLESPRSWTREEVGRVRANESSEEVLWRRG